MTKYTKFNTAKKSKVSIVVVTRNRIKELERCLVSLNKSTYRLNQIIVVDNGSSDETLKMLSKKFPKVKVLPQSNNIGAAAGRNRGASVSTSELVFFLDDDAFVAPDTIKNTIGTILTDDNIAIVQTKVLSSFNKKKILGIAHDINTTTSLITAYGFNEEDKGQFSKVIDIPMVGTGWLVRKKIFDKVGRFDEKFFVPYEDSDISLRIRKMGYRIVFDPKAEIWHDDLKVTDINPRIRSIGIASAERALYVGRNKIYFMRKHSEGIGRIIFFVFLLPLFILYHCVVILSSLRFDILKTYLKGVILGFQL